MLWALARTSGRALPMIIDTPLARLDSEHRTALVERYFPAASHQVIVLSTDTEVDDHLLDRLAPSVSHAYRLDYEPDKRSTVVVPGYFGDKGDVSDALQQA
jgi:DNA sulfur modification protein DndD